MEKQRRVEKYNEKEKTVRWKKLNKMKNKAVHFEEEIYNQEIL